jgi:hypothetical protein
MVRWVDPCDPSKGILIKCANNDSTSSMDELNLREGMCFKISQQSKDIETLLLCTGFGCSRLNYNDPNSEYRLNSILYMPYLKEENRWSDTPLSRKIDYREIMYTLFKIVENPIVC